MKSSAISLPVDMNMNIPYLTTESGINASKLLDKRVVVNTITSMLRLLKFDIMEDDVKYILDTRDTNKSVHYCSEIGLLIYGSYAAIVNLALYSDFKTDMDSKIYRSLHFLLTSYMERSFYGSDYQFRGRYQALNDDGSCDHHNTLTISSRVRRSFISYIRMKDTDIVTRLSLLLCELHSIEAFTKYSDAVNLLLINYLLVTEGINPVLFDDEFVIGVRKYTEFFKLLEDSIPMKDVVQRLLNSQK